VNYLIWSYEHNSWWAPHGCGYEESIDKAGRYSVESATRIVADSIMMDELVVPEFWAQRYGSPDNRPYDKHDD